MLTVRRAFNLHSAMTDERAEKKFKEKMWPDSSPQVQANNLYNLKRNKKVDSKVLEILFEVTCISPNEFFEWEGKNETNERQ